MKRVIIGRVGQLALMAAAMPVIARIFERQRADREWEHAKRVARELNETEQPPSPLSRQVRRALARDAAKHSRPSS